MEARFSGNAQKYEKADHERRTRKLFIGGVSFSTTDEDFFKYFAKFGELEDCVLIREKDTGQSRGFGFVTYKDKKVTDHVAEQQLYLDGRRLDPKPSISRYNMDQIHEHRNQTTKVFVGGLHDDAVEAELSEHFGTFGEVLEVNIMYDRFTNAPRGFGFVTFKEADVANKVINWDQDHMIHGKKVDCKPATARKDAFKHPATVEDKDKKPTSREERWRKYHGDKQLPQNATGGVDVYGRHRPHARHDLGAEYPASHHPESHVYPPHVPHSSYSHHSHHSHHQQQQHHHHLSSHPHQQSSYASHGQSTSAAPHSSYSHAPPYHHPPAPNSHHPHYMPPDPHNHAAPHSYDYSRYDPYYRDTRYSHSAYPPPQTSYPHPSYPPHSTSSQSASTSSKVPTTATTKGTADTASSSSSKVTGSTASQPTTSGASSAIAPPTYDYSRYPHYAPYPYDPNAATSHSRYDYYAQYATVPPSAAANGNTKGDTNSVNTTSSAKSGGTATVAAPTKVANSNQQTAVPSAYGASRGSAATNSAQTTRYSAY